VIFTALKGFAILTAIVTVWWGPAALMAWLTGNEGWTYLGLWPMALLLPLIALMVGDEWENR
jgi:hypothetical protein